MKDYIATPKPNSYQIFHTIVIPFLYESMFRMEVQIRTREMNLIGERGIAAHYSGRGFVTDLIGHTMANGRSSGGKIVCLNNANIALRVYLILWMEPLLAYVYVHTYAYVYVYRYRVLTLIPTVMSVAIDLYRPAYY
ncbi:hypothetical protein HRI_004188100 [Hibiscus trionum]|uniref:RelA/SpoT domain-containing protein n=1 Tax=Hibiscus trionum TaxID=183268 RepID=A0A9W7J4H0_HIBTR|nr:hypothetical protein HRI_004188100 [Hibiscus trionum]